MRAAYTYADIPTREEKYRAKLDHPVLSKCHLWEGEWEPEPDSPLVKRTILNVRLDRNTKPKVHLMEHGCGRKLALVPFAAFMATEDRIRCSQCDEKVKQLI